MQIYHAKYPTVEALQWQGEPHEQIVKCFTPDAQGIIQPIPPTLEVFGPTTYGVKTPHGYKVIKKGDWLDKHNGNYLVVDKEVFLVVYQ